MMKQSTSKHRDVNLKSVKIALKTLVHADTKKTSVRNAFQQIVNKEDSIADRDIQAAFHYVQEISKKRGILEHGLELILKKMENRDLSLFNEPLVHVLLLLLLFLLKIEHHAGNPPSLRKLKKLTRVVLHHCDCQLTTPQKIQLDQVLKHARDLDLRTVEQCLSRQSLPLQWSVRYNFPQWLMAKLSRQHEKHFIENLLKAENQAPKRYFRIRRPHVDKVDSILAKVATVEPQVKITLHRIGDEESTNDQLVLLELPRFNRTLNSVLQSFIPHVGIIQDKASALIPSLLFPIRNEMVVDLTAGPGQKYLQLLEYSHDARIIGCEYHEKRLSTMITWQNQLLKWCFQQKTHSHVLLTDSTNPPIQKNSVDKILLDAPCSSTGILAKYPDHRWHRVNLPFLTSLQEKLLENAISLLKPGGKGVYSVCSLLKDEGEEIITKFRDQIEIIPFDTNDEWTVPSTIGKRTFRHLHGTDNFFVALFQKK